MDITGTYTFDAPPERVWDVLMDTDALASCIPGCEGFEPDGKDRYRVTLVVEVAAFAGTYELIVGLKDKVPHTSYRLTVKGKGKASFVKGDIRFALEPKGKKTKVAIDGTVDIGVMGWLAERLIGNVNKTMQDRFFTCLQSKM